MSRPQIENSKSTKQFSIAFLLLLAAGFAVVFAILAFAAKIQGNAAWGGRVTATLLEVTAIGTVLVMVFFGSRKLLPAIFDHYFWSQAVVWLTVFLTFAGPVVLKGFYRQLHFQISPLTVFALTPVIAYFACGIAITNAYTAIQHRDMKVNRGAAFAYLSIAVAYLLALALPLITVLQNL